MASSPDRPLIERLKERKLVQWALAYIAGGWVILQVLDVIADPFGVPVGAIRVAFGALVVGFFVTLVLAWYHGEQGRQRVSGPELLIIAGLLVVAGIGLRILLTDDSTIEVAATASAGNEADVPVQPSVAVLPFVNMSGNPDNEYFSDGITEELLNALAQIPGLRVPARTSSFAFKGQSLPVRIIADTLDVAHVLEGSVRRDGERVLITAQLVDAQTDTHLWSNTYERQLEDIFAIQREIATAITDQLQIALSPSQQQTLVAEGTQNPEAHDAYLRGQYLLGQRSPQSVPASIVEFRRALELDPGYPEAQAGLSESYLLVDTYAPTPADLDFETNLRQGVQAAERAVSLAPDLGVAQNALGFALWSVGEWEDAEQALVRAIELSPGFATAHQRYALLLMSTGRANEAIGHAERAVELDPVSPIISLNLGWALLAAARIEEAVEQFRGATELAPGFFLGWLWLAEGSLRVGEYDEGLDAFLSTERLLNRDAQNARTTYQAMIDFRETGQPQTFPDVEQLPTNAVWVYDRTGHLDRAMELFQSMLVRPGAHGMAAWSAAMYEDPRYQALLEEAGITW